VAIQGDELRGWVDLAREKRITLLMDEFYSHFMYGGATSPISTAAFVEDVDEDPVVIIDGLTKCFRYPGWRVGWVVAPKQVIRTLTAAGSFLDGGPSRPIQRAAIDVLAPNRADQETDAVRNVFARKQEMVIERLGKLGVTFPAQSDGTFYVFGDISDLPDSINDGVSFMHRAFGHRVLVVPGAYFDVGPQRSRGGESTVRSFVRFSFGPPHDNVSAGLDRLDEMVAAAQ